MMIDDTSSARDAGSSGINGGEVQPQRVNKSNQKGKV